MSNSKEGSVSIAFIHPDLGIGGAERLIVDAALGLQQQGNKVIIYTSHCDKSHCFEEIKDGTIEVEVIGDHLPTHIYGKFAIVCATIRQIFLTSQLLLTKKAINYDVFIVDQLSTCLILLHKYTSAVTLFYCHFPDQYLTKRDSLLKKLYRIPFDLIEQFTISTADHVVVNSNFTKSMYHRAFKYLNDTEPDVIYPCVSLSNDPINEGDEKLFSHLLNPEDKFYLSINRFDRAKNILLALKSFALSGESKNDNAKLLICGGYDERVIENVICLKELQREADILKLSYSTIFYPEFERNKDLDMFTAKHSKIIFLTSISTSLKELLLNKTEMLLYTPTNEHFGIVPVEAMKHGKPVLATTSGGPLETVETLIPGRNDSAATGWLRDPKPERWAKVIDEWIVLQKDPNSKINFGKSGPNRVKKHFSRDSMTQSFEDIIEKLIWKPKYTYQWENVVGPIFNLILQLILTRLFPGQMWPFISLAIFALLLRDFRSLVYWVFALILLNAL
ncbi:GDP-Man:Man(1)GlcNAc(2)-PP-dolichol alpha-1,3-mannosyltransferase NDAI_0I00780 [Naumovozyma dairenensis CBS 421]|uniref:Alpha-1,3/1,6-mannosyltransferase ALG2 n=1 Tax=Naumovozyma dairenensis (strain ATCC 10597 / BCRC 20456 / CBS 421 / NBRC 0211 / NRRL Y-12639) TaxID=1071378 RepID=G0WFT6_NAUDC|nr:hypothetical protein NDAI_0I00780 [Naumovozyma dairenensis CBS 421]CCD26647.1 hypothetical protein NDAI_0I00780 [Naumovozyma dairenensis CBS 421]